MLLRGAAEVNSMPQACQSGRAKILASSLPQIQHCTNETPQVERVRLPAGKPKASYAYKTKRVNRQCKREGGKERERERERERESKERWGGGGCLLSCTYYPGQKNRYSREIHEADLQFDHVILCDIELRFNINATRGLCASRARVADRSRCRMISDDRTADQSHEYLGCNNFFARVVPIHTNEHPPYVWV